MGSTVAVLLFLIIGSQGNAGVTYHSLYQDAVEAYNQGRWFECYTWLTKALRDYHNYREEVAHCWLECQSKSGAVNLVDIDASNFLQPQYLDMASAKSECFHRCKVGKFPDRKELPDEEAHVIDQHFEDLTAYDYLQLCAYKSEKFEDAMSASFTYLAAHPGHDYMTTNVNFYRGLPEAQESHFYDREQLQFKKLFSKAAESYGQQDWLGAIHYMEESLQQYYGEVQKCMALCNAPLEPARLDRLLKMVSSAQTESDRKRVLLGHWLQILECKQNCRTKLDLFENGSYLKEHYNYLQFSYYKLDDLKRAAGCTGTYLYINPTDESSLSNKDYYSRQHQVIVSDFNPRNDAVKYVTEKNKDMTLLPITQHMLTKHSPLKSSIQSHEHHDDTVSPPMPQEIFGQRSSAFLQELQEYLARIGVTELGNSDTLFGNHRMAVDRIINDDQCEKLMHLASVGAANGHLFKGPESKAPSSPADSEKFDGLTVSQAAEMARQGLVSTELAQLFLEVSETGRAFLEKYLNLKITLMFQHTELLCRTALDKEQSDSHSIRQSDRRDNCFIQPDGSCLKRPSIEKYRDFTGLLYLNGDFEGGDFYFAHKNMSEQIALHPKCGRFIGFESDDDHGVRPVTSGRRCALATLYTFNPANQELEHAEAHTVLRSISTVRTSVVTSHDFQNLLDRRGAHVSLTEDDLSGSQRFAVDSFLTENQCHQLMKLANMGATSEGYQRNRNRLSPHTDFEHYIGMSLSLAVKMGVTSDGYQSARNRLSPHTDFEHFIGMSVSLAAKEGAVEGDGYRDAKGSPHTKHEMFEGLTIQRAAELAAEYKVTSDSVKLYLSVSQDVMEMSRLYLTPNTPLYFSYTHLVCRTALNDKNLDRTDLSHPIHSDNCIIQPDNSCKRVRPAYTERDFSAILYLNDNFNGGDFFFTHQNMTVQSSLKPKCGRVVAFNASQYHGVRPVLAGQRCAVALWFTLDRNFEEPGHPAAWSVLSQLDSRAFGPDEHPHAEL